MLKKKKFIIAGFVLVIAFVVLFYFAMISSSIDYYNSVSELMVKGDSIYDQSVQVKGVVDRDSISQDIGRISFTITDDTNNLPVVYQGIPPDSFWETGNDVVLEGKLTSEGIFQVSKISTKCPSKYEAET